MSISVHFDSHESKCALEKKQKSSICRNRTYYSHKFVVFVFGIVNFWREDNVANFAPKRLNNSYAQSSDITYKNVLLELHW